MLLAALVGVSAYTSFETHKEAVSPTSPTPTSTPTTDGSLTGLWSSQTGLPVPSKSTCANFSWQVTSQTSSSLAGSFSASCEGNLTIKGTASGVMLNPTTVDLKVSGPAVVGGFAACDFSLSGTGTIANGDTLTIPYSGTTCLGPVQGTETLRRKKDAPPPPPEAPAPPPAPPSSQGPNGFSLANVQVVGSPNVLGWPVTSRMLSIGFRPGWFHFDHTKRGQWPGVVMAADGTLQEATIWIFYKINGQCYGTGAERVRPNQTDKPIENPWAPGEMWLYDPSRWGPMSGYQPQAGEPVGFMIAAGSTRSDATIAVAERSNVIFIDWPRMGETRNYPPFIWEE